MNYEQRYKEALKAVKELQEANPSDDGIQNWVNENFPELKESGDYDERIRKALIDGFKRYDYGALFNGCFVREILPWLEKQGESYTKKDVDNAYIEGMAYAKNELEKQSEQKSAWSKEDEEMLRSIIATCELTEQDRDSSPERHLLEMQINWLKSLKTRYTWKSSDEQIKVCKEVYADILSAKGFDLGTVNSELNRLEEQLKKLKE